MTTEEKQSKHVELDELLAAEFNYISQTAMQAFEDRSRVSSFYLIAVGSLIATMFGTQFLEAGEMTQNVKLMFSGIFLLLTLLGLSTVIQLARLRSAWYESMMAMNQIKDFAIKQNPELGDAFRWKTSTLPAKYKSGSVSSNQALEVSLIGGLMFGATVFFLQYSFFPLSLLTWLISLFFAILAIMAQMAIYKHILT